MATPTGTFTTLPGTPESTIRGTSGSDVLAKLNVTNNLRVESLGEIDELHLKNSDSKKVFENLKVFSGDAADSITTHNSINNSLIQGGRGGDTILVGSAITKSTVRGGSAQDTLTSVLGSTSSMINGNKNIDKMYIGDTHNSSSIHGGEGNDTINLNAGYLSNTKINGDEGDDTITDQGQTGMSFTMSGNSGIYGNDGNDTITLSSLVTKVTAQGGAGNDTIKGGTNADSLTGGSGADSIEGGTGADTISGSAGIDSIKGGAGIDLITGGSENDVIQYINSAELIAVSNGADGVIDSINGGTGTTDTIEVAGGAISVGANGTDTLARITNTEVLKQTAAGTTTFTIASDAAMGSIRTLDMSVNTGADTITLTGVTAAITISAGAGANAIVAGSGADTITALGGDDTITAGLGVDSISGGVGANDYITNAFATGLGTVDKDEITNFNVANTDQFGNIKLADMLTFGVTLTELNVKADVADTDVMKKTAATISANYDLASATANTQVLIAAGDYASSTAVQTDIRDHLTSVGTDADEGILVLYDNGVNSTLAIVDFVEAEADGQLYAAATVTDIIQFTGVADSSTIVDANYLNFIA